MPQSPETLRKAGLLVATLDARTADALLEKFSEQEANLVRRAAAAIEVIHSQEQDAVIREFLGLPVNAVPLEPSGVELDGPELASAAGQLRFARVSTTGTPRFTFLQEQDCEHWAPFLEGEHPQTIAVVASHLQPHQAARLLGQFAPSLQAEVLRRLVDLEELENDTLCRLEEGLESRIAELTHKVASRAGLTDPRSFTVGRHERKSAGLAAVGNILAADADLGQDLRSSLHEHQPHLARQFNRATPAMSLDELVRFDASVRAQILKHCDPETIALALAGCDPEIVEQLLAGLPTSFARDLRRASQHLGPTSLHDLDTALQELLTQAGRQRSTLAITQAGGA